MQQITVPTHNVVVALPADDVIFLLRLASGASTTRENWKRLEVIDRDVAEAIAKAAIPPADPPVTKAATRYDPNTPEAAAKRDKRKANRATAEAENQL